MKLEDLTPQPQDKAKLAELFDRLEFKSWLKELQGRGTGVEGRGTRDEGRGTGVGGRGTRDEGRGNETATSFPHPSPLAPHPSAARAYETILTDEQLRTWLARIEAAELVSIDTETTSLDPMTAATGRHFAFGRAP